MKTINYLKATIEKIENTSSISELNKIRVVINTPSIGWKESDRSILNERIDLAIEIASL